MARRCAMVVSPHLDDAVLSATARLLEGDACVVTVFAGLPPEGIALPYWDRLTGAIDARQRMRDRLAEDDEAIRQIGATAQRLDLLDRQYRDCPADSEEISRGLRPFVRNSTEIWLPAGIGGNPDHLAVRDAMLDELCSGASFEGPVFLYADFPYVVKYGWPRQVTGNSSGQYLDIDYWLTQEMVERGLNTLRLKPRICRLGSDAQQKKLRAIAAYQTQIPGLRLDNIPELLRSCQYELSWVHLNSRKR